MVKEKKHLQKIHYMTLSRSHQMSSSALQIIWPLHLQSLKLLRPTVKEKMDLQESTLFFYLDLQAFNLQVKVTLNVAQCPLHHVTHAPTEFEVTTSKALGEAFTRKFNIWPLTLTLGSRSHKIWSLTLTQDTKCCPVPSTLYDLFSNKVWSCYVKRFRRRCIYKKIQYLTLDLGGQGHTKCCPVPSTSCDLFSYKVWSCYV